MKNNREIKIVGWIMVFICIYFSIKLVNWVLKRNDNICKNHFGNEFEYRPTFTSGYCLNKNLGVRKYLD
jgi:hypothetical protein